MKMMNNYNRENKLSEFMTIEEEHAFFYEVCDRIIANPRFYLDNLDGLSVFKCSFINYKYKKTKHL